MLVRKVHLWGEHIFSLPSSGSSSSPIFQPPSEPGVVTHMEGCSCLGPLRSAGRTRSPGELPPLTAGQILQPRPTWLLAAAKWQSEMCWNLDFPSRVPRTLSAWGTEQSFCTQCHLSWSQHVREQPTHSASCASPSSVWAASIFLFLLFAFSLYFWQWAIMLRILPSMLVSSRGVRGRLISRT